jgi:hypothetical protein
LADAVRCYERALCLAGELGAQQDVHVLRDCLSRLDASRVRSRAAVRRGDDRAATI